MKQTCALSMLAETTEEFIQLECARRQHQTSSTSRLVLPSQLDVYGHKSQLKEKLAQAQHHAFLLRTDVKAALLSIIDNVREIASHSEEKHKTLHCTDLSLSECHRFMTWATDVEKLLFDFEPSGNHANDPLLRMLEHLQFLQNGPKCLADVAMDARAALEHWDRLGLFEPESPSEDEKDKFDQGHERMSLLGPDPAHAGLGTREQSYAYQSVRGRTAARVIKRNVLTWMRSKASFCERVAEIELFGRTTEALLKELSLTSSSLIESHADTTDIFALSTRRWDFKSRYSSSIAFKDLLEFSKHMALFPVDQALRTVEDVTRRRHLFDSRCAMKIQGVWRRVRDSVRVYCVLDSLHLQQKQEAQAKREATKRTKKRKTSGTARRDVMKGIKWSVRARPSIFSSKLNAALVDGNAKAAPSEGPELLVPATLTQRTTGQGTGLNDKLKSPASTPRSRNQVSQVPIVVSKSDSNGGSNGDSDGDITDVETAWKSFMDTVAVDIAAREPLSEIDKNVARDSESASDPVLPTVLPSMKNNWETWSDDETSSQSTVTQAQPSNALEMRPPSFLPFDTSLQTHTEPYTSSGLMAPFVETGRSKKTSLSDAPQRTHLYELDFSSAEKMDASFVHIATNFHLESVLDKQEDALFNGSQASSRLATDETMQREPVRQVLDVENRDRGQQSSDSVLNRRGFFLYGTEGGRVRREVIFRKGSMVYSPLSGPPEQAKKVAVDSGSKGVKEWHHSTVAVIPEALTTPHPPVNRFHPHHKKRAKHAQLHSVSSDSQSQALRNASFAEPRKQSELPVLLHQSPRHVEIEKGQALPDKKQLDGGARETERRQILSDKKQLDDGARETERVQALVDKKQLDGGARDADKQIWKRGVELPNLAAPRFRDRTDFKRRSSHHKQRLIIARRAPSISLASAQTSDRSSLLDKQLDGNFFLDEEHDKAADGVGIDAGIYCVNEDRMFDERQEHMEIDRVIDQEIDSNVNNFQRCDSFRLEKSNEMDELQRLNLARHRHRLICHQLLVAQLQNEEDAATHSHKHHSEHDSQDEYSARESNSRVTHRTEEVDDVADSNGAAVSALYTASSDVKEDVKDDADEDAMSRRRLRVKVRDATVDPFTELSGEEEDVEDDALDSTEGFGMTMDERDAAFQKLLAQYLGLLQCAPAEVARRLQHN